MLPAATKKNVLRVREANNAVAKPENLVLIIFKMLFVFKMNVVNC